MTAPDCADPPDIDVIVRTLAEASRRGELARALDSISNQSRIEARPIVVVNGNRWHPAVIADLEKRDDIKLDFIEQGSLVAARSRGLALVEAPVFAFLDDDDELIKDSVAAPVRRLIDHSDEQAVIALTDMSSRGEDTVLSGHGRAACQPLRGLLESCWLHPGSGFFRSSAAMKRLVDVPRGHMEWTTIAARLATGDIRLCFMDVPTVVYHDTGESLSKNTAHHEAELEVIREIGELPDIETDIKRRARRKYINTLHILASRYQEEGRRGHAWRMHLRSLCSRQFFSYVLYTRRLLR